MLPNAIELDQLGAVVTVRPEGPDLGYEAAQALTEALSDRMRYHDARGFVFDLEAIDFLASPCIGVLVQFLQEVEHVRGRIALANCSDPVKSLFQLTKLDEVFHLCDDLDEAVAEVRGDG